MRLRQFRLPPGLLLMKRLRRQLWMLQMRLHLTRQWLPSLVRRCLSRRQAPWRRETQARTRHLPQMPLVGLL